MPKNLVMVLPIRFIGGQARGGGSIKIGQLFVPNKYNKYKTVDTAWQTFL
jgi:hypothetical protein